MEHTYISDVKVKLAKQFELGHYTGVSTDLAVSEAT